MKLHYQKEAEIKKNEQKSVSLFFLEFKTNLQPTLPEFLERIVSP